MIGGGKLPAGWLGGESEMDNHAAMLLCRQVVGSRSREKVGGREEVAEDDDAPQCTSHLSR